MKRKLTATIEEDLYEKLEKLAAEENRKLSNLVETLLYRAIDNDKSNQ